MSEIIQDAITKIDSEAEKGGDLEKSIAQYIIDNCLVSDAEALKATAVSKSLRACANKVTANARKQATGGCAIVEDSLVWRWVREYYGFSQESKVQSTAKFGAAPVDILDFM